MEPLAAAIDALRRHWPEHLIEAGLLGAFMVSACVFGALLGHPGSPVRRAIPGALTRRSLMGLLMGLTAVALVYSPFGQRSGAHFNPAVTLAFAGLGKVAPADAAFYIAAQFAGGVAGVGLARAALGRRLAHPEVNHVATLPGEAIPAAWRAPAAFGAEVVISFLLMTAILLASNHEGLRAYTGFLAGAMVWLYITVEAPISGMSMNPARSFGSAVFAGSTRTMWIYGAAPVVGMALAAGAYGAVGGPGSVICAKLCHPRHGPCIFNCGYETGRAAPIDPTR